jgi:hypothetical protein
MEPLAWTKINPGCMDRQYLWLIILRSYNYNTFKLQIIKYLYLLYGNNLSYRYVT